LRFILIFLVRFLFNSIVVRYHIRGIGSSIFNSISSESSC
jgi:hypothetical protein